MEQKRDLWTDERLDEFETWTVEGFDYLRAYMRRELERAEREIRDLRNELLKLKFK